MVEAFAGFHATEIEGVPVLWLPDRRFKTFRFALQARRPMDRRAAARSLLPGLLLQGTRRDPDRPALARRMERLFGAVVVPSTGKEGECHVLRFSLDSIAPDHAPGHPDLLGDGLELLADLLARPRLENGAFPEEVFVRERTQATHAARALFNDKAAWATQQALAHACAGEPMAIPEHGGVEAIESLRADEPEKARQDFLAHGEMLALAHGALPEESLLERIGKFLRELPTRSPEPIPASRHPEHRTRGATVERATVQQSKLVLVFRLPAADSATWAGRVLFASLLGGGPHSRLFREVREKHSLAYYAHATLERFKGLLLVQVGLDQSAAARVEEEVLRQVDELRAGTITTDELETARAGVLSALASVSDGIGERMEFTARQWLLGQDRSPEQQQELYVHTTAAQVAQAAEGLWLDHSYLLAPDDEGV